MLRAIILGVGLILGVSQAACAGESKEHIVKVVSDYDNLRMSFDPKTILIQPGDTVSWVNEVAEDHNIVSYPDGFPKGAKPLLSPFLKTKGEKWSHKFSVKGTYEYHCLPHLPMGMHGSVIVSRPSPAAEFHKPTVKEMQQYSKRLREFFDDDEFKYTPKNRRVQIPKDMKHQHTRKH